jgi:hypothetical protein
MRSFFQTEFLGDLEQKITLLLAVLRKRSLIGEQTTVYPSSDFVTDSELLREVVSEFNNGPGKVHSEKRAFGTEEGLVLPV